MAGVQVQLELESESIFSGGSHCQSCLKSVDFAALVVTPVYLWLNNSCNVKQNSKRKDRISNFAVVLYCVLRLLIIKFASA